MTREPDDDADEPLSLGSAGAFVDELVAMLVEQTLAQTAPDRQSFLEGACAGDAAVRLAAAIRLVLERAIARQSARGAYRDSRFLVYDRQDQSCSRKHCGGVIRRRTQGGRSTFHCPKCQR